MNKWQKEVIQSQLDTEKETISELKKMYEDALKDCEMKIALLSARADLDPENLQSIIYQQRYQEAIKAQIEGVLEQLHTNEFATVSEYLQKCYEDGYIGVMYDIAGQGMPLILPMDQEQIVAAIQTDTKLSKSLYESLGEDIKALKKEIRMDISRGIASGSSWNDIAADLAHSFKNTPLNKAYNRATTIARTEGHRIQCEAQLDAQKKAKEKGCSIVKQWDSTLDGATRDTHRKLDGQIREVDDDFEVDGMRASAPGQFGDPSEDCNCRCQLLQRAKWALGEDELETLRDRAAFHGLDKTKDFDEFKEKYMKATNGLGANDDKLDSVPEHKKPEIIGNVDFDDQEAVKSVISTFEQEAVKEKNETACVITRNGTVYKCYGVKTNVFPDYDLGDELECAIVSHNHPIDVTAYSFSKEDYILFEKCNLSLLRGVDEKYTYEFSRTSDFIDEHIPIFELTEEDYAHEKSIMRAEQANIGYRRWLNG